MNNAQIEQAISHIPDSEDRHKFLEDTAQWIRLGGTIDGFFPIVHEWKTSAGTIKGQYFLQDLQVAQWIFAKNPRRHVDIGSRIDGFVAHVASFRPIEVLDIRPLEHQISQLQFVQCDLMDSHRSFVECADSVSCLHALEHFGLGRYGDTIDPAGHLKGFASLVRMVESGGTLYLSVPIGKRRVEFNAHRIFGSMDVFDWPSSENLDLAEFRYVGDDDLLHDNASPDELSRSNLYNGLGIYVFRKR